MSGGQIRIDRLELRVGGLSRAQGRELGQAVARQLADLKIEGVPRRLPRLCVRVESGEKAVQSIANEIVIGIRRGIS